MSGRALPSPRPPGVATLPREASAQAWLNALARDERPGLLGDVRHGAVGPGSTLATSSALPDHLILLVIAGACRGAVAGRQVTLGAGDSLWARPGPSLRLAADARPVTACQLRLRVASAPERVSPFLLTRNCWDLRSLLDGIVRDLADGPEFAALRSRSLLVAALSRMLRAPAPPAGHGLLDWQRAAVQAHVEGDLAARPSVGDLAKAVGMSEDSFTRRFRRTFGQAPRRWLVCRRIHAAAQRLDESDDSVGAVAARYGYSDVFFFSRQFKAVLGVSPRAWRTRHDRGQPNRTSGAPSSTTKRCSG